MAMTRGQVQHFADMPDPKHGQLGQDREAIEKLSDEVQKLKNLLYWLQNKADKPNESKKPESPHDPATSQSYRI